MSDAAIRDSVDARFQWLYGPKNPFGAARTWLVHDTRTGEAVGATSVIPRTILIDGAERRAGVLGDFVVLPEHRFAGPAVMLQRALAAGCRELGFELTYVYPNQQAWPVFARVGYKALGQSVTWVRMLRGRVKLTELIATRLGQRMKPPKLAEWVSAGLGRVASVLSDSALALRDQQILLRTAREFRHETLTRTDERFDELSGAGSTRVRPFRSAAFLNWRYAAHPTVRYRFHALFDRASDRLRGYAVSTAFREHASVQDLVVDGSARVLEALLSGLARSSYREGFKTLGGVHFGDSSVLASLKQQAFFGRPQQRSFATQSYSLPKEAANAFQAPESWSWFDGELDI